jgi:C1A family cysteine protease
VSQNGIIPMPALTESQLGGHAVIAVGYDQSKEAFLVRNSWGDTWGIGGYCWMPEDYLANPDLCDDRWVIKLVET